MKTLLLTILLFMLSLQIPLYSAEQNLPFTSESDLEEKEPDSKLEKSVKKQFKADAQLANLEISISAKSGVITLSGEVESGELKQRAKETATGVTGVKRVINRLTVAK